MNHRTPLALVLLAALSGCPQGSPSTTGSSASPATFSSPAPTAASATPAAVSSDFLIVPGQRFGPVTKDSTQASLEEQFGKEQVRAGDIPGPEGLTLPGLTVFADQADKTMSVYLSESEPKRVSHVQINGDSSVWKTAQGLGLGTTLAELETLNGRPFELMGLYWDYGGHVTNWKGGALEGMTLQLNSAATDLSEEEMTAISGDKTVTSDLPALRKANPRVSQITVIFDQPAVSPSPATQPTP